MVFICRQGKEKGGGVGVTFQLGSGGGVGGLNEVGLMGTVV